MSLVLDRFSTSDTPEALALAALEAIPALSGTKETGFAWSIYTGDLVSHDPDNQLSRLASARFFLTKLTWF